MFEPELSGRRDIQHRGRDVRRATDYTDSQHAESGAGETESATRPSSNGHRAGDLQTLRGASNLDHDDADYLRAVCRSDAARAMRRPAEHRRAVGVAGCTGAPRARSTGSAVRARRCRCRCMRLPGVGEAPVQPSAVRRCRLRLRDFQAGLDQRRARMRHTGSADALLDLAVAAGVGRGRETQAAGRARVVLGKAPPNRTTPWRAPRRPADPMARNRLSCATGAAGASSQRPARADLRAPGSCC